MKRWMFLIALLSAFTLTSCIYEPGPMGPPGPQGPAGPGMNWSVRWFTVDEADWVLKAPMGESFFQYDITGEALEDLDAFVAREGTVEVYCYPYGYEVDGKGNYRGTQAPLPYSRFYHDKVLNKDYALNYDFEYNEGLISLYATYSDFAKVAPPTITFRIVLQW